MATVILVRHGRSQANADGVLAGRLPGIQLDEKGRSQAMTVGERLRGVPLTAAVRSPILRCQQTLDLALESAMLADVEQHVDDRLTECDYGEWTGRKLGDLVSEPLWATVQKAPSEVQFPGGESMLQMRERLCTAVRHWNELLPAGAVWLLVAHADPIKAVLSDALGQPFDDFQRIMVDPASISVVHYPDADPATPGSPPRPPVVVTTNSLAGQVRTLVAPFLPNSGRDAGPQPGGGAGSSDDAGPADAAGGTGASA